MMSIHILNRIITTAVMKVNYKSKTNFFPFLQQQYIHGTHTYI